MASTEKNPLAQKHQEVRQLLEQAAEDEICLVSFPDGRARVDFTPHPDSLEAVASWKQTLATAVGLWADREGIAAALTVAELYAGVREGDERTAFDDAVIAATSEAINAELITKNNKHFPMLGRVAKPY